MQFAIQMPGVFKKGFRYRFYLSFRDPEFRRVMALFVPVAIGLAGSRINVAVNTVLVSFLEKGSMTWLNYAFRIMHLPLGLFGMAVGAVALPKLSRHAAENDLGAIHETLGDSLKMVLFLTVPTSIVIAFLSYPNHGRHLPAREIHGLRHGGCCPSPRPVYRRHPLHGRPAERRLRSFMPTRTPKRRCSPVSRPSVSTLS